MIHYQESQLSGPLLAALLTPRGRGAVATIRLHGDHGFLDGDAGVFRAANGRPVSNQPFRRIVFGTWGNHLAEAVVLCRWEAATLEIHCHGGEIAAERILSDCRRFGVEIVDWQRLMTSSADVLQVEFQVALSRAKTWRTAEYLLSQADGRLRAAYERLASIDWTDAGRQQAELEISELLVRAEFGVHLTEPWSVVLTGRPNVGKSSLINTLLGFQRSIVFDQPGTTRDVVTAETALDGWPVRLSDTAGLRKTADSLEVEGIELARRQLAKADLIVELIDLSNPEEDVARAEGRVDYPPPDFDSFNPDPFSRRNCDSLLLVAHKCDLPDRWGTRLPDGALRVSSITGFGVEELQREIVRRLVPVCPPLDMPTPVTARQVQALKVAQAALSAGAETDFRVGIVSLLRGEM